MCIMGSAKISSKIPFVNAAVFYDRALLMHIYCYRNIFSGRIFSINDKSRRFNGQCGNIVKNASRMEITRLWARTIYDAEYWIPVLHIAASIKFDIDFPLRYQPHRVTPYGGTCQITAAFPYPRIPKQIFFFAVSKLDWNYKPVA